jgi:hypothetical protein
MFAGAAPDEIPVRSGELTIKGRSRKTSATQTLRNDHNVRTEVGLPHFLTELRAPPGPEIFKMPDPFWPPLRFACLFFRILRQVVSQATGPLGFACGGRRWHARRLATGVPSHVRLARHPNVNAPHEQRRVGLFIYHTNAFSYVYASFVSRPFHFHS